jgi:hypothetical protein
MNHGSRTLRYSIKFRAWQVHHGPRGHYMTDSDVRVVESCL